MSEQMSEVAGRIKNFKWLILSIVVIAVDQVTKQWAAASFELYEVQKVTEFFNFTLAHNPGAAFSFLANAGEWKHVFFTVIAVGVTVFLLHWLWTLPQKSKLLPLAIALVIAGALGNLIDRLMMGYVIDFLDFHFSFLKPILGHAHWPAFNVADISIFIGAALLITDSLFFSTQDSKSDMSKSNALKSDLANREAS